MTEPVQILGLRELREALVREVPAHFRGKVLQKALSAGARPIVKAARDLAPVKTGVLRRAIYAFRDKANSTGVYEQRAIGVRSGKRFQKSNKDAFYWRWIEFGRGIVVIGSRIRYKTREIGGRLRQVMTVSPTKAGVLGNEKHGFFGTQVRAVPARPFLRPAFDQNRQRALDEIRKSLADEIPKAAKKASWRTPSR